MTWDIQEMPVTEIWLQPASEGIDACVIMKMVAGPKRYARFFPHATPARIEWGWVLGETAIQIWPLDPTEEEWATLMSDAVAWRWFSLGREDERGRRERIRQAAELQAKDRE